jgi:hypothetical protein
MIKLSPRSYVFNGLEILREGFIEFIYGVLITTGDNWWFNSIYLKLYGRNNEDITEYGDYNDMHLQLDELRCFKIVIRNPKIFSRLIDLKLVREVRNMRDDCAHVFRKGGVIKQEYADKALFKIACLMESMEGVGKDKLSEIEKTRNQLYVQARDEKPIIASKQDLFMFLVGRVWEPAFIILKDLTTIDEYERNKLRSSMEDALGEADKLENADAIVEWFNYHLNSQEGVKMYLKLKSIKNANFQTFEDARLDFLQLCYGE